jgi:hypothetical protein
MSTKRYLLIVLLCTAIIFSISAASANDLNATGSDEMAIGNDYDDVISAGDEDLQAACEEDAISLSDEDLEKQPLSDEVKSAGTKTFTDLNKLINGNKNRKIYLNNDYTYDSKTDSKFKYGIKITRSVTIYGNGHTISGNEKARIFFVSHHNVVFRNINFINGNVDYNDNQINGGAIYGDCTCYNCNFINNYAVNAGAMDQGTAINCKFINNSASYWGGAAYYISAYNCKFEGNSACYGGALWYCFAAKNCEFTNNFASLYGGAANTIPAVNCKFVNNEAMYGGALNSGTAVNCVFIDNEADYGGATYGTDVNNCRFTDNYASNYGGAMYKGSVIKSTFKYNTAKKAGNNVYKTKSKLESTISLKKSLDLVRGSKYVIATLKDSTKTPIKKAKVYIKVNGKTKKVKTNSKGQVIMSVKGIAKGSDIKLVFKGNKNYKKSKTRDYWFYVCKSKTKIAAKNMKYKAKKAKKFKVALKSSKNKPIKNKKVTLKVNKKLYKAKTNRKGKATFKLSKLAKKGSYKAVIKYKGNKKYGSAQKTVKITVK